MAQIAVIDLGTGNLRSVAKAVEYVAPDADVCVTRDVAVIASAERIVLPGQGAIGTWMQQMGDQKLRAALAIAIDEKPVLGICVGMQALFQFSEEDGGTPALGVFDGRVQRFENRQLDDKGCVMKVPQMGWSPVTQSQEHALWQGIGNEERFYFANSYYAICTHQSEQFGTSDYGVPFTCAAAKGSLFAVQFHPEKSARAGLQLIKNFTLWSGE